MRLGVDEIGVTELMGVTEHSRCLAVVAAGLLLDGLDGEPSLLRTRSPSRAWAA